MNPRKIAVISPMRLSVSLARLFSDSINCCIPTAALTYRRSAAPL
jgi:hypothetical protein